MRTGGFPIFLGNMFVRPTFMAATTSNILGKFLNQIDFLYTVIERLSYHLQGLRAILSNSNEKGTANCCHVIWMTIVIILTTYIRSHSFRSFCACILVESFKLLMTPHGNINGSMWLNQNGNYDSNEICNTFKALLTHWLKLSFTARHAALLWLLRESVNPHKKDLRLKWRTKLFFFTPWQSRIYCGIQFDSSKKRRFTMDQKQQFVYFVCMLKTHTNARARHQWCKEHRCRW